LTNSSKHLGKDDEPYEWKLADAEERMHGTRRPINKTTKQVTRRPVRHLRKFFISAPDQYTVLINPMTHMFKRTELVVAQEVNADVYRAEIVPRQPSDGTFIQEPPTDDPKVDVALKHLDKTDTTTHWKGTSVPREAYLHHKKVPLSIPISSNAIWYALLLVLLVSSSCEL